MQRKKITYDPGVSGGELGADDHPIGLRHLQFGGEALRPLGFLRIVVAGFILLLEKCTDELPGALVEVVEGALRVGTRRSRFVVPMGLEDQKSDEIKRKVEGLYGRMYITRGGGGLPGDGCKNPQKSVCCSPLLDREIGSFL